MSRIWSTCALLATAFVVAPVAFAVLPYGIGSGGAVYDWPSYLFVQSGDCSLGNASANDLPASFSCEGDWKLSDHRDTSEPAVADNPQEFYGVKGTGLNRAWEISTGRPDVVIAVLDSGIRWEESRPNLLRKYYLNRGELPPPLAGLNPLDTRFGGYDASGDGVFNVDDYAGDTRVSDLNGNGDIDPEDLIRSFSDGVDDDGNGYTDDISGWDFFEDDNNPQDDVDYGHGTEAAEGSAAEAGLQGDGGCPNCMILNLRVGDSFVADVNHFAEAVVYAVDNDAALVQEALASLNRSSFGQAAVDYAWSRGVLVNASAGDEAAAHHNWPAGYEHTLVVNSIRNPSLGGAPGSYLYLNGCTNFGSYIHVSIPSTGCSSEATARSAGLSGLLISAARSAVERGDMSNYLRDGGSFAPYPLSASEATQLWRLAADDIDFSSDCPTHGFCAHPPAGVTALAGANHFATTVGVGLLASERYQTVRGWDFFTGYGRANAARLLRFIGLEGVAGVGDREYLSSGGPYGVGSDPSLRAEDRIPPEADLHTPLRWRPYAYDPNDFTLVQPDDAGDPTKIVVTGRVAANRVVGAGGTFDWVLEWAPHVQGPLHPAGIGNEAADGEDESAGPWTEVTRVNGTQFPVNGVLGKISVASVAAALTAQPNPFTQASDPTSHWQPERYGVRLRLRVISHPVNGADTLNNEAIVQKQIDVYPATELSQRSDLGASGRVSGGMGSPSFHDLDGDGVDELLVPSEDGLVHAYTDVSTGAELAGWPVHTDTYPGIRNTGDNAYTRGDVPTDIYGSVLLGSVAAADLDRDGTLEVVAADLEGKLYAWEHDGSLRPGFPASVDRSLSQQSACTPATIPACDDYEPGPVKRNASNRRDWAINAAPSVGDLDPNRPGLEIVFAGSDGHVYAFHADASPVAGWPVLLRDPLKVASMDPGTHAVSYVGGANAKIGTKGVVTPSLGDLDGNGSLEVALGVNEEYEETPNADLSGDALLQLVTSLVDSGNTRVYALRNSGTLTPGSAATDASAHLHDQAYLPGWPVSPALLLLELLPYMGTGTAAQTPLADLDGNGDLEIVSASVAGPGYVFRYDGSSFLGSSGGFPRTLGFLGADFGAGSSAADASSILTLSNLALGSLDGGGHLSVIGGGAGLHRLADIQIEARQPLAEDHLSIWDASTGLHEFNAPLEVNDVQFYAAPIVADLTGDGDAEVIQGSAVSDTVVAGLVDDALSVTRHHSAGWQTGAAALGSGPFGANDPGKLRFATLTREGWLRTYPSALDAASAAGCAALAEWPEYGHDGHNSGNYSTDAERPYPLNDLVVLSNPDLTATLNFTATGDDRRCGSVDRYEVRYQLGFAASPNWELATPVAAGPDLDPRPEAGLPDTLTTDPLSPGAYTFLVRAFDEADNTSAQAIDRTGFGSADSDGDRRPDFVDNCLTTQNSSQADTGGVLPPGPNGIGDACECGDVDGAGQVDVRDVAIATRAQAGLGPGIQVPGNCNTVGSVIVSMPDAFGVTLDCDSADVGRMRASLAGESPGIEPVCAGEAEAPL